MTIVNRFYCTLTEAKAAASVTTTGPEAELKRHIRSASRWIEQTCGQGGLVRAFIPYLATKKFDYEFPRLLNLKDDLISITTLTNGDGNTMTPPEYFLYPANETPKRWIEPNHSDNPFTYNDTHQQAISIDGMWGYCNEFEPNVDAVKNATGLTETGTSLEVATLATFSEGMTLLIGFEAVFVSSIGATSMVVVRADNGTIGAIHAKDVPIAIYKPPTDINLVARILASRWLQRTLAAWTDSGVPEAGFKVAGRIPTEVEDIVEQYRRFSF